MPPNKKTGKTDQCKLKKEEILKFCIKQLKTRKGKQPMREHQGGQVVSEMKVHVLTPESGLLYANSPAVISQTLSSASISAPHSPAPVTAAEAPTPLLGINPTASTSTSSISAPVAATRDSAASQCHSAHSVADLAAKITTVTVSGPSTHAIPSLILPNIPPKQRHGPLILLPL
jgi:hypothetical protein